MSAKDVTKPDFVEVLKRRRRTLDSWLEEVKPIDENVLVQLKKQYSLSSADEAHIRNWAKKQLVIEKVKKTDMEDVLPVFPEEVETEEEPTPRKRKKPKVNEEAE